MAKKSILAATPAAKKTSAPKEAEVVDKKPVGAPKKNNEKKIGVWIPTEKWKALQYQRIQEGRPVSDIVNDAIDAYLNSVGGPEAK